jgi:leucyl-tRNA synthetase
MKRYNPLEIEPKWQQVWDDKQIYKADLTSDRPKYYAMSMFNYPSGAGIHIGHAMNYTISDVMARYKRQAGYESYHPVGWDSFGLPAENFAIKTGISPQESMAKIIPSYHTQYKAMGWSNDWSKEVATSDPRYYKWTQWIFEQVYKAGLAYQDARMQWWCTKCQTVLSNEQVIDGKCWRHDGADDPLVEKKEVKQWFFKITDYAERLLDATDELDWTESVKVAQKNWIGKSVGSEVDFSVVGSDEKIKVFTTRPDTIFGATFMVVAPDHPIVPMLVNDETRDTVNEYTKQAIKKTELERQETKEKTGVFTGSYAINPANGQQIPIWVADYVLYGYGTGAIMAVPAHDERDHEFAEKYGLEIKRVIVQDFGTVLPDAVDVTGSIVIGYDPRTKQYMSLMNHNVEGGMRWLVSGGLDEGETYEEAALREMREEAGFDEVEALIPLGEPMNSYFYNPNKKSNRRSYSFMYLAIVDQQLQKKQNQASYENYSVEWSDLESIEHDLRQEPDGRGHWIASLELVKEAVKDYEAGKQYSPPIHTGEGTLMNSGAFDGLSSADAREQITAWLEQQEIGESKTIFKIRDWSVSRQRYWGAPIPIVHCLKCGPQLVPEDQLPVVLPVLDDFAPSGDGRSALARAKDWLEVDCPQCGGKAERETDTLDTYICSSWYFLRYLDPENTELPFGKAVADKWMPVDFYNGADHATAHMIYARFITRFLAEQGHLSNPEPFKKFLFNGKVTAQNGEMFSKSKGNGVDPLEIINQGYGADSLRVYLMFAAPLDTWVKWDPQGVPATHRFLNRIWNLVQEFQVASEDGENEQILKLIHPTIKKVTHDLERQKYNTAIAAMMETVNKLYAEKARSGFAGKAQWQFALESLVALVAPFSPHMADELWHQLGRETSVQRDSWPQWDETYLVTDTITVVIQVNGKVRAQLEVPSDIGEDDVKAMALKAENVTRFVGDKKPAKVIYVPGRLVNIVV